MNERDLLSNRSVELFYLDIDYATAQIRQQGGNLLLSILETVVLYYSEDGLLGCVYVLKDGARREVLWVADDGNVILFSRVEEVFYFLARDYIQLRFESFSRDRSYFYRVTAASQSFSYYKITAPIKQEEI